MDKELQKEEAIKRMRILKLMGNVIQDFKKKDVVYYSDRQNQIFNAVLYWISNHQEYAQAIKDFEEENNALVYHAQLTRTCDGELLTLLYVSDHQEEWELDKKDLMNGQCLAYVINLDDEFFSEFGMVGLRPSMGGVVRTA